MASVRRKMFWQDQDGAAMLEFTAAASTFLIILYGVIEFALVFYQFNAASKATQYGARLAAVTQPVAVNLAGYSGVAGSTLPGDAMPPYDCSCTYSSSSSSTTCGIPSGSTSTFVCGADDNAMNVIFYGRSVSGNSVTVNTSCNSAASGYQNLGMCNLYGGLTKDNIIVRYTNTGLGYAGRPGGPVPTVTVSLTGVTYNFILIGGLANLAGLQFPSFATTVTGEDLNSVCGSSAAPC